MAVQRIERIHLVEALQTVLVAKAESGEGVVPVKGTGEAQGRDEKGTSHIADLALGEQVALPALDDPHETKQLTWKDDPFIDQNRKLLKYLLVFDKVDRTRLSDKEAIGSLHLNQKGGRSRAVSTGLFREDKRDDIRRLISLVFGDDPVREAVAPQENVAVTKTTD